MASKVHYLSEAKMIARIADADEFFEPGETDFRLADLYVQIAQAEALEKIANILETSISPSLARTAGYI